MTTTKPRTPTLCTKSLAEFIPATSPRFVYPHWLEPVVEALADAEAALRDPLRKPVFVILSVPPQHGKSTLVFSWLTRLLGRYPHLNHAYCTYGQELSEKQSGKALMVAQAAGVELARDTRKIWETGVGGGIVWTSIGGALTGDPVSGVGIVDDPFKDRRDAESQAVRETVWDFYQDVFDTRCHPQASQIVINTRWHVDDLSGRLIKQQGRIENGGKWRVINLPAIATDEDGEERALWPEGRPLEYLREKREKRTRYQWASVFQGEPIPKGGALFQLATTCKLEDVPTTGRVAIGVDLAYTKRTSADYSAAVVLREYAGKAYVAHVLHEQVRSPNFIEMLQKLSAQHPGAPMVWHGSTTERGGAETIRDLGVPQLRPKLAKGDPFVRAQPVAAAWNAGDIIVPFDAPWSRDILDEVQAFTGVGDRNDDLVVALASAFDGLPKGTGVPLTGGARVFAPPRRQPQRGGRGKWLSR